MDCFSLGGVMIAEENIDNVLSRYKRFCDEHDITYPLHSWAIRGGRGKFAWLKRPESARVFFSALDQLIEDLPFISIACVIHRPGYIERYKDRYQENLWFMCRTAYCILIERAAKFAEQRGRRLEINFEESGKKEDRAIVEYDRLLKQSGLPFSTDTSSNYTPLQAEDFRRILWGKPKRKTKNTPMMQIADLVLYPMAKAGYEATYKPYLTLKRAGKLIDCHLEEDQVLLRGIKYSCFENAAK